MRRQFLILTFCVAACYAGDSIETFNAPAVKVNTQIISIRDVELVFSDSFALIQDRLKKEDLNKAGLEDAIRKAWKEALETAIQDKILDQRADKRRKDIIQYYLARAGQANMTGERAMEQFRRQEAQYTSRLRQEMVTAAGGENELRAALKRRNQTMQQWEAGIARELFRRDVVFMELAPVVPSPKAARIYYEQHPEMFSQEDAWRLRRIRVPKAKFSSAEVAHDAARMVKEKIAKGAEFGEIAAKVSDDPDFSSHGGFLTKGGKSDLPTGTFPAEEKLAARLKDGELSDPIDSGDWFVIVQRVGYQPAVVQSFEQAADRAESLAFQDKLKQKKREMYDKLKDESYIEIMQKIRRIIC